MEQVIGGLAGVVMTRVAMDGLPGFPTTRWGGSGTSRMGIGSTLATSSIEGEGADTALTVGRLVYGQGALFPGVEVELSESTNEVSRQSCLLICPDCTRLLQILSWI